MKWNFLVAACSTFLAHTGASGKDDEKTLSADEKHSLNYSYSSQFECEKVLKLPSNFK